MTPSGPAILLLHSSCASLEIDNDDTDTSNDSEFYINESIPEVDTLPLWCDLMIIPEIPVSSVGAKSKADSTTTVHFIPNQSFHSCGTDNVLSFHGLPPAVEGRYLMSLQNCITRFHVGDEEPKLIHTSPSSLFFQLVDQANDDIIQSGDIAELDVEFDFSSAFEDYLDEGNGDDEGVGDGAKNVNHESNSSIPLDQCNGNFFTHNQLPNKKEDEVLGALKTILENETRQIDNMLYVLGFSFVILVGIYIWIAYDTAQTNVKRREARSEKTRPSIECTATQNASTCLVRAREEQVDPNLVDTPLQDASSNGHQGQQTPASSPQTSVACRIIDERPPVESIIVDHAQTSSVHSCLLPATEKIQEPPQLHKESSALLPDGTSHDAEAPATFLIQRTVPRRKASKSSRPRAMMQESVHSKEKKGETASAAPLSPSSRLASEWLQSRSQRRGSKKKRSKNVLVPIVSPSRDTASKPATPNNCAGAFTAKIQEAAAARECTVVPVASPSRDQVQRPAVTVARSTDIFGEKIRAASNKKRLVPISDDVHPHGSCPSNVPTSLSDAGSFLNDYW